MPEPMLRRRFHPHHRMLKMGSPIIAAPIFPDLLRRSLLVRVVEVGTVFEAASFLTRPTETVQSWTRLSPRDRFTGRAPIDSARLPTSVFIRLSALVYAFTLHLAGRYHHGGKVTDVRRGVPSISSFKVRIELPKVLVHQVGRPLTVSRRLDLLMVLAALFAQRLYAPRERSRATTPTNHSRSPTEWTPFPTTVSDASTRISNCSAYAIHPAPGV